MQNGYLRKLVLGAFVVFASSTLSFCGQYFEIKGAIDYEWFDSEQTNSPIKGPAINFTCISGSNEWRIENDFAKNAIVRRYFDGEAVFDSSEFDDSNEEKDDEIAKVLRTKWNLHPMSDESARTNISVRVRTTVGGHPFGDMGMNLPWLAFCSGTYLKTPGRIIPPPCAELPNALDAFGYGDRTECFQDSVALPRRIDLITSDGLHEQSVNDYFYRLSGEKPKRREGFGDGILKFHYEVTAITNINGITFPLQFSFFQNDWWSEVWYLRYRGTGRVISIRETEKPMGLLRTGVRQCISDFRFYSQEKNVNGIVYCITNNVLPSTNDPVLKQKFALKVTSGVQPREPQSRRRSKTFVWCLLATSTVFFALVIWKNTRKNIL